MQKPMILFALVIAMLSPIAFEGFATAQTTSGDVGAQMGAQTTPASASVSSLDRQFVVQAYQGNLAEVQVGNLALSRSSNPQVRQIAQQMIQDHSQANTDLIPIANALNITLPTDTDARHKAVYNQLSSLQGTEFDRAFIENLHADHQATIAQFQQEISTGTHPAVRQYATTYLPAISQHRDLLAAAASDMQLAGAQTQTGGPIPQERPAAFQIQQQPTTGQQSQRQLEQTGERPTALRVSPSVPVRGFW